MIKFIYSEKATNFCKISTVDLTYVKSTVEISQNFAAFSEYMNFTLVQALPLTNMTQISFITLTYSPIFKANIKLKTLIQKKIALLKGL